ncbi:MAG: hypothetical protein KDF63_17995, partial [Rhodoferax sp.]|nr:hypothetical protein [Rhodoferax sp.]
MTAPQLPAALEPLRQAHRWVVWKRERVNGRPTKVPYADHRRRASSTDAESWRTFDALPRGNGVAGPGLMLGEGLQGVDLDVCLDDDGVLETWAAEVVERLDSYTEASPSGRGLKVFFRGPGGRSAEAGFGEPVEIAAGETKRRELAYFTEKRFFTVTGRAW